MQLGSTQIDDTYAEAFRMRYARLIVTAHDEHWLNAAADSTTGYATSVINCDAEAGVEAFIERDATPDGRPGAALMFFAFSNDALAKSVSNRVGQCIMTCPSTAVYNGMPGADEMIPLGKHVRFFGDGFQKSKQIGGIRYWRIPVMDGEFLVEESVGVAKGIAGGNFILQAVTREAALDAARASSAAIANIPGVITPFPGGVVRSGSKVGSRYKKLKASTNDEFCPGLRGRVETRLHPEANAAIEVVLDGVSEDAITAGMRAGIHAAAATAGVIAISAGNYGGTLGKFHFHLHELLSS
ncbi:MAG: formylmethanofuran--tetrahydromethanopterin N-formyltransferase [Pirellulales bacterium]|nr:formylmethanofuran--tetrahydromethanopterin N-formyltransferase [Pirellulales bacterium]